MDPNSYQALIAGQAGPDNPCCFGPTPSKHVQHLAKIAPLGRHVRANGPATGPSFASISPYDNPYTAIARPAASLSIEAISRPKTPSPTTARPATSPSIEANTRTTTGLATSPSIEANTRPKTPPPTTAGPAASPSIAPDACPITPVSSTGGGSSPSSPSLSTSRSPSPDAVELMSALANCESLSDDALYDAALKAQQAMVKWQDEYNVLKTEISRMRGSPYNRKNLKANPRKLEDPEEYDQKHHNSLQQPTPTITRMVGNIPPNTARPCATNPINKSNINGHEPRNKLYIDMNKPMQPVKGKRIRKPRVIDDDHAAVTAPKKATKRAREPDNNGANAPAIDQPAAKKQDSRTRSTTPPKCVNTARNIETITKENPIAPENSSKKGKCPAKGTAQVVIKKEEMEETKGKDPVRAAAARLMWAKRQANGTNGRYGGAPMEGTVAKGKGK